ncbi:carbohydrate ABC transporter permease [Motilibacter peucedani]|uniref:carbohydrate ABC transporter permease n=1 Tax=Motilibacter peucedani TaxID=598650 RepID=UPI000EB330E2
MGVETPARTRGSSAERREGKAPLRPARVVLQVFLAVTSLVWLFPLLYAVYTALRPYQDTAGNARGYFSLGGHYNFKNFTDAWTQADFPHYFVNTLIVTAPSLVLILILSSMVAFGLSRFNFKGNLLLLMIFTAGNLLPQQVLITPLYRLYIKVPLPGWMSDSGTLYDSYWGLILIHVAFQIGFCTFVLSNYMKTLPHELTEAALVDGASVWRQYYQIVLPLCRAPFAALATLEFTWIYNDFFWATVLVQSGDKKPITSALANLHGQYFTNNNLIAAASLLTAIPTLIVYFALQRQFIGGLTVGATKG